MPQLSTFSGLTEFLRSGEETESTPSQPAEEPTESSSGQTSSSAASSSSSASSMAEASSSPSTSSSGQVSEAASNPSSSGSQASEGVSASEGKIPDETEKLKVVAADNLQASIKEANDYMATADFNNVDKMHKTALQDAVKDGQILLDEYNKQKVDKTLLVGKEQDAKVSVQDETLEITAATLNDAAEKIKQALAAVKNTKVGTQDLQWLISWGQCNVFWDANAHTLHIAASSSGNQLGGTYKNSIAYKLGIYNWDTGVTNDTYNIQHIVIDDVVKPVNMRGLFSGLVNVKDYTGLEKIDTTGVTDMGYVFQSNTSLPAVDIHTWDTSSVTCMAGMFRFCPALTSLDLSNFNTSRVRDSSVDGESMWHMFTDTGNPDNFTLKLGKSRFYTNAELGYGKKNIEAVNTGTVDHPKGNRYTPAQLQALYNQSAANCPAETYVMAEKDSSDLYKATAINPTGTYKANDSLGDAAQYVKFTDSHGDDKPLADLEALTDFWDDSKKVVDSISWVPDSNIDATGKLLKTRYNMHVSLKVAYGDGSETTLSLVLNPMQFLCKDGQCDLFWDSTSNTLHVAAAADGGNVLRTDNTAGTNTPGAFYNEVNQTSYPIKHIVFDDNVVMKGSQATKFWNLKQLTDVVGLEKVDTSEVTDMENMFFRDDALTNIDGITSFDTHKVTSMRNMFELCSSLKNLDLRNFDTSKVTDMANMFNSTSALKYLNLSSFNVSQVSDEANMFYHFGDANRFVLTMPAQGFSKGSGTSNPWYSSSDFRHDYVFAVDAAHGGTIDRPKGSKVGINDFCGEYGADFGSLPYKPVAETYILTNNSSAAPNPYDDTKQANTYKASATVPYLTFVSGQSTLAAAKNYVQFTDNSNNKHKADDILAIVSNVEYLPIFGYIKDANGAIDANNDAKGLAMIRITYADGSTDEIPLQLKAMTIVASGSDQHTNYGVVPSNDKAKAAVTITGNDDQQYDVTYEWYKDNTNPLQSSDLQRIGSNSVMVKVTLKKGGEQVGDPIFVPVNLIVDNMATSFKAEYSGTPFTTHVVNIGTDTDYSKIFDDIHNTAWKATLTNNDKIKSIAWNTSTDGPTVLGSADLKNATLKITYNDDSTGTVSGVAFNVVGATATSAITTLAGGTAIGKDADNAQAKAAVNTTNVADYITNTTTYSWSADATDTNPVNTTWDDDTKDAHDAYVIIHYSDGTSQAVKVSVKVSSSSDQYANTQKANIQTHQVTGGAAKDAKVPAFDSGNWSSWLNGDTTEIKKIAWSDPSSLDLGRIGTNLPYNVTITYKDNSVKTFAAKVDVAGATTAGGTTTLAGGTAIVKDADNAQAKAAVNTTNVADYITNTTTYSWSADATDTNPVNTTWDDDTKDAHDAYVIIHYSDGTSQAVKVSVKVSSSSDQYANTQKANIQTHQVTGGAAKDAKVPAFDSGNWSSWLNGDTTEIKKIAWSDPSSLDLGRIGTNLPYNVTITYKDNSVKTFAAKVDVAGATTAGGTTTLAGGTAIVKDADNAQAKAAVNTTNVADYITNTTTYSWSADATDTNPVNTTWDDDTKDAHDAYVIIHYSDGTSQAVKVSVKVSSSSDQYANTQKANIQTHQVTGGAAKDAKVPAFDSGNWSSWLNGDTTEIKKIAWSDPSSLDLGRIGTNLPYNVTITYKDNSVKTFAAKVDVAGATTAGGTTTLAGGTAIVKDADNAQAKAAVNTTNVADYITNTTTYSWSADATDTNPVNTTWDDDTKDAHDAYVIIHYSDGTSQAVKVSVKVSSSSDQYANTQKANIQTHQVTGGAAKDAKVPAFDSGNWSSWLNGDTTEIKKIAWSDPSSLDLGRIGTNLPYNVTITYKDNSVKTFAAKVDVAGATTAGGTTTLAGGTAIVKDADNAQAKAAVNTTNVADYITNTTTYSWSADATDTNPVNTTWDDDTKDAHDAYVIIHYSDGTSQAVKVSVKVSSSSDQYANTQKANIQTHQVTGGAAKDAKVPAFDSGNWSSWLNGDTTEIKKIAWSDPSSLDLGRIGTNLPYNVTITYKDNSVKTFAAKVDVAGATTAGGTTTLAGGTAIVKDADNAQAKAAVNTTNVADYITNTTTYSWSADATDTNPVNTTWDDDTKDAHDAYVIIHYSDGTSQAVKVSVKVSSSSDQYANTQKANIQTHQVTGGAAKDAKVPAFDSGNWSSWLNGDTTEIKKIAWSDPSSLDLGRIGTNLPYNVTITYKDNSVKTFAAKVDVAGATTAGGTTTLAGGTAIVKDADNAQAKAAVNTTNVADYITNTTTYSWSADATDTNPVNTTWDDDTKDAHDAYVIIHYSDGTSQAVKVSVKVSSSSDQYANTQKANIQTHQVTGGAAKDAKVPAFDSGNWSSWLNGDTTGIRAIAWSNPSSLDLGRIGTNLPYNVTITYKDNSVKTFAAKVDVAGATTAGGTTTLAGGTAIVKDADNAQAKAAVNTTNVADYITNTTTYSWSADATDTNPVNTTWDNDTKNPHDAYVIIHYSDGTSQAVKVNVKVSGINELHSVSATNTPITVHKNQFVDTDFINNTSLTDGNAKNYVKVDNNSITVIGGLTDLVKEVDWIKKPASATIGTNTAKIQVKFKDGSKSAEIEIPVIVDGATAVSGESVVSGVPVSNSADFYISNASSLSSKFHVDYEFVKNSDGAALSGSATKPTLTWSTGHDSQLIYVKVKYYTDLGHLNSDGDEIVAIPVMVKSQASINESKIRTHNLVTHVGANTDTALSAAVTVDGKTNGTDYTLAWADGSAPDVTVTDLVDGSKIITKQVLVTFNDHSSVNKEVQIKVVGAQYKGTPLKVYLPSSGTVDVGSVTGDKVKKYLNTAAIDDNYSSANYTWSNTETGSPMNSYKGEHTLYAVIDYHDGTTQKVAIPVEVVTPYPQGLTVYQGAKANVQGTISNYDKLKDYLGTDELSWDPEPDTSNKGTVLGEVELSYNANDDLGIASGTDHVRIPVKVIAKPVDNSMAAQYRPIGGMVNVPQFADLPSNSKDAAKAIANSMDMPKGTTYEWDLNELPDTTTQGKQRKGFVNVRYPDGSYVSIPVTVDVNDHNTQDIRLKHNAYVYDDEGRRANGLTLKAGSVVTTYGTKVINGRDFYLTSDGYYLAAGNDQGVERKLDHNAYTYTKQGKRIDKHIMPKGVKVKTYGIPLLIKGKEYYIVGHNQYMKKNNFPPTPEWAIPGLHKGTLDTASQKRRLVHSAYIYDETGKRLNQITLRIGSIVQTTGTKEINGKKYYILDNNTYIKAGNIDKKQK